LFDSIDPLGQLRDIHEPASLLWPSFAGWLLAVAIAMAIFLLGCWQRARQAADPRRAARLELAELRRRSAQGEAVVTLVAELGTLLRQIALTHFPRSHVAGLCGRRWLEFLDREFVPQAFVEGTGASLAWAPYARDPDVDVALLLALTESALAALGEPGLRQRAADSDVARRDNLARRALQQWHLAWARWRVRSACLADDAVGARTAWLRLAQLMWSRSPPRGLQALAAHFDDPALHRALAELDRCLYADGSHTWHGRRSWQLANAALKRVPDKPRRRAALPELYG
jgi:hypothetical protein